MADVIGWVQVGTSLVVGLSAGVIGARANQKAAEQRYLDERLDEAIPAVREGARLLAWAGRVDTQVEPGEGPSAEALNQAQARVEPYRHDLPPRFQRRLDPAPDFDQFEYGEWVLRVSRELFAWLDDVVGGPPSAIQHPWPWGHRG